MESWFPQSDQSGVSSHLMESMRYGDSTLTLFIDYKKMTSVILMLYLIHPLTGVCMQCLTKEKKRSPSYNRNSSVTWQNSIRPPRVQKRREARNVRRTSTSINEKSQNPPLYLILLNPEYRVCITLLSFPSLFCRWQPAHSGETEDEDHESLLADAECGAAQRESAEESS